MAGPSGNANPHLWEIRAVRELILLLAAAWLLWLLYALREILIPLFLALVLAQIFNPFVTLMQKRLGWPRPVTIVLLLAGLWLSVGALFAWLGPLLWDQFVGLARDLPGYINTLGARFNIELSDPMARVQESLDRFGTEPRQILAQIFKTTGRALGIVTAALGIASYFALSLALMLLYFFFFSWHFNTALEKMKSYIPLSRRQRTIEIVSRMDDAVGQFFRGRLVIALIMGLLLSAGWWWTEVPYWFFLGMLTGLLNIVPYLSAVSWPVAILLKYVNAVTSGGEHGVDLISIVVWPSAVYIVVQLLEGWLLTPWIQSGQTDLGAATVLLVVIIGGTVAGVLGMLFAIPLAACIKIFMDEVVLPAARRWAMTH